MEIWHIWVIVALVLVVVEIFTQGFAVLCLAFGAGAAAIAAACSAELTGQLIWFSVVTLISFVLVRPMLLKFFRKGRAGRESGTAALKGREAVVSERISVADNTGRVAVDGDDWKAVSADGSVIEKGTRVTVLEVDSVILKVTSK
ncbi:MAG: NfeD family protein [Bacteroidetes bacterium]|uniref:NfeD family protein n=1 Tax=Candidatus Cryptobacteroides merdavium TaxID=2840769 RepID=A0A9D9EDD4_9BACT|nr:NfeD family protein [Candidatus Cryptobacteroides merdavium]